MAFGPIGRGPHGGWDVNTFGAYRGPYSFHTRVLNAAWGVSSRTKRRIKATQGTMGRQAAPWIVLFARRLDSGTVYRTRV